jgi:hypothetical protein
MKRRIIADEPRECEWQGCLVGWDGLEALLFWRMVPNCVEYKRLYKYNNSHHHELVCIVTVFSFQEA